MYLTSFHTIGVKCPVVPEDPDLHPGKLPQNSISEYQAATASVGDAAQLAQYKFSPAGPPTGSL